MSDLFIETPAAGHNSVPVDKLKSFLARVESINEEIDALTEDRKSIFDEAKVGGVDVKALKKIIAIRRKDIEKWRAEQEVLDQYLLNLGLL